jgi:predicted ATPase
MDGFRLLHRLCLTNILSYGPKAEAIDLEPLNVLIGPNGSGKSNLIEAISLLKAAPSDLAAPIRAGGGATEWIWKGSGVDDARLRLEAALSPMSPKVPVDYALELARLGEQFEIAEELIKKAGPGHGLAAMLHPDCYRFHDGKAIIAAREPPHEARVRDYSPFGGVSRTESILAQVRDVEHYPEITFLGFALTRIQLFRSIGIGRDSKLRGPHRADEPASFLLEDGRNLGVVVSDLLNQPPTKKRILKELQRFYSPVEDITTKVYANTVETSLHERGLTQPIPSIRLSDGTLRYLALLTILCHPSPPPLVCIEDPEVGLHPDILPRLGDLLIEASQRMQLIVTTHSDILVSALSEVPEAVVVCERDDEGTHLRRLDAASLEEWLKKYSLGELWVTGEIGGTT